MNENTNTVFEEVTDAQANVVEDNVVEVNIPTVNVAATDVEESNKKNLILPGVAIGGGVLAGLGGALTLKHTKKAQAKLKEAPTAELTAVALAKKNVIEANETLKEARKEARKEKFNKLFKRNNKKSDEFTLRPDEKEILEKYNAKLAEVAAQAALNENAKPEEAK